MLVLVAPRKLIAVPYVPLERFYRRKPRQIRKLLGRLDRDTLRAVRISCRQVLALPRNFTYEHVQVCQVAHAL
jgi:hypothetical protein